MKPWPLLEKFAQLVYRARNETTQLARGSSVYARAGLLLLLMLGITAALGPALFNIAGELTANSAVVAIPGTSWKSYFGTTPKPCPYDATNSLDCAANPAFANLWRSSSVRGSAQHRERVSAWGEKEFWIATEIAAGRLEEAYRSRANYLLLGWIPATYRIWVDGHLTASGSSSQSSVILLTLPLDRLSKSNPLRIAIQIVNDGRRPYPDFLLSGVANEGLYTAQGANAFVHQQSFIYQARPIAQSMAHLLIATFFFLLWMAAPKKQEYFYIGLFVVCQGLLPLYWIDVLKTALGARATYAHTFVINSCQAVLAMFLGFSFSRVRRSVFSVGLPILLALPVAVVVSVQDPVRLFALRELIVRWAIPAGALCGALSCVIQAAWLWKRSGTSSRLPVRVNRLLAFAACLVAMAGILWLNAYIDTSPTVHTLWFRFTPLVLVYVLGAVAFSEYRDLETRAETSPVSEYHRRPVLPDRLTGAVLVVDLKNSEPFYRRRARQGNESDEVATWRLNMRIVIGNSGGTVIRTKGDEITAVFDQDNFTNPVEAAISALQKMAQASAELTRELLNQGSLPSGVPGLYFRAAIAPGDLRPAWEEYAGRREPVWEEAGTSTPLLTAARLLEFERKFGTDETSLAIALEQNTETLCERNPAMRNSFTRRNEVVFDKHGNEYRVAVFDPNPFLPAEHAAA